MLLGKKKKIAKYLEERESNYSNFDLALKDYLSGDLTIELKKLGLSNIEIHIDWLDDYKCIGIQAKYNDYFLDIQIDEKELAIGCDKDEPDCDEFFAIGSEPEARFIYFKIRERLKRAL